MVAPSDLARLVGRRVRVEYDGRTTTSQVVAVGTRGVTLNVDGEMLTMSPDDDIRIEVPSSRPGSS